MPGSGLTVSCRDKTGAGALSALRGQPSPWTRSPLATHHRTNRRLAAQPMIGRSPNRGLGLRPASRGFATA